MEPYQQRVVDEHLELKDRMEKLETFLVITSQNATSVKPEDLALLRLQHSAMQTYADVLMERIKRFN